MSSKETVLWELGTEGTVLKFQAKIYDLNSFWIIHAKHLSIVVQYHNFSEHSNSFDVNLPAYEVDEVF